MGLSGRSIPSALYRAPCTQHRSTHEPNTCSSSSNDQPEPINPPQTELIRPDDVTRRRELSCVVVTTTVRTHTPANTHSVPRTDLYIGVNRHTNRHRMRFSTLSTLFPMPSEPLLLVSVTTDEVVRPPMGGFASGRRWSTTPAQISGIKHSPGLLVLAILLIGFEPCRVLSLVNQVPHHAVLGVPITS